MTITSSNSESSSSLVRVLRVVGLLAYSLVLCGADALAQDAVRATQMGATECTIAPRPKEDLIAMLKAPPGALRSWQDDTPFATPVLPTGGVPADAQTIDLVTATARELAACFNIGDFARINALVSDDYFMRTWGGVGGPDLSDDEIAEMVEEFSVVATPPAESRIVLVGIEDVQVLPDGRVLATVLNQEGGSRAIFIKVDDRYLVDWAYPLPDEGTPSPQ